MAQVRAAWAQGRNYDVSLLTVSLATPGFILGEAVLGESVLGDRGTDVPFDADFTSITIDEPTTVEDGLFVHREVATLKLSATLPDMVALRGRWLTLAYDGRTLFAGRVARAEWTESVDVDREYLPGNTAIKTCRVSLAASNGEEVLASTAAQISGETWELAYTTRVERVENLTGYPVTVRDAAADLPLNTFNAGWDDATASLAYQPGDRQTLLDALRLEAKLGGDVVIYQPRADEQVILQPVNRWLTGDEQDEALLFTDQAITSPITDAGDDFLTTDQRVSYSRRQVSEDPSLFTNSVVLKFSWYLGEGVDPAEYTFGPYRANGANPQDVEVDLGMVNLNTIGGDEEAYKLARAVVQTLPIKANPSPFTSALEMPLQSTRQLEGTVPGMAVLGHDGDEERVAVLGRTHTITPDRWLVSYTTGPEHLLTRTSDREPAPALVGAPTAGSPITFHWTVPDLPTDKTFYEFVLTWDSASLTWYTSDQSRFDISFGGSQAPALPSGTARSLVPTGGISGTAYYVAYTSNPTAGTDNPNDLWREGQIAFLGQIP